MSLLVWGDRYKLGVREIDNQHAELVRLANELSEAMQAGHGRDVLHALFRSLVDYTVKHFATEERLMRMHAYPQHRAHAHEHEELKKTVSALQRKVEEHKLSITVETLTFLRNWLVNHILKTDKHLAEYLTARNLG